MARLLHLTDLHTEFAPFDIPPFVSGAALDGVLIGGDTGVGMQALSVIESIWDAYRIPVLFVLGNHEYYGQEVHAFETELGRRLAMLQRNGADIHWLQGTHHTIAGTRIVGATLWTDMQILGDGGANARRMAERGMNDYRRIQITDAGPMDIDVVGWARPRALTTADTMAWHDAHKRAIFDTLATPFSGPTVVLTHHLPSKQCIAPRFQGDGLNPAFASEMTDDIRDSRADWWLYGHSHGPVEWDLERSDGGLCRMRTNCRGYPSEWDHTGFDPLRIIDTSTGSS